VYYVLYAIRYTIHEEQPAALRLWVLLLPVVIRRCYLLLIRPPKNELKRLVRQTRTSPRADQKRTRPSHSHLAPQLVLVMHRREVRMLNTGEL
jgi:hypothetical protein